MHAQRQAVTTRLLNVLLKKHTLVSRTLTVTLWAINVSVTSPGFKTSESASQTALDAGGLAQNSTVRDRRWPVMAVRVLLAGYTAGRPESRPVGVPR